MLKIYLISFSVALTGTLILTPLSIWLAHRFGVLDPPAERKVHSFPMPRWGGLSIMGGILLAFGSLWIFLPRFRTLLAYRHKIMEAGEVVGILSIEQQLMGILVGGIVVLVMGLIDDKKSLPPIPKLLAQIIAAYVAMVYGVRIAGLVLPFADGYHTFSLLFSQAITIFWIIGFMNAVNLVDGLDGLAAGLVAIAAGTFLVVSILQGESRVILFSKQSKLAAVLAAAVCGASLGFLFYNFHPARVFMGDGGALSLGFLLGTITVIGTLKTTAVFSIVIPIIVVALPILDVLFSIIRRFKKGAGLMHADRGHFHHRLLALGWTQREIVLGVYVVCLLLSMTGILLTVFKGRV